jgi:asparagine synthase (glutamine-hydrolysing)
MLAAMAGRGLDGRAVALSGPAGIANAWLDTTGEEEPALARAAGDQLIITADCRLDNRSDLIEALGTVDRARSDAGLILDAYARWDVGCLERLEGDFAFAIWDARKRRIFAARDHFGIKPLYWTAGPRLVALASTIGAILATDEVRRPIDERWVASFLAGLSDDVETTPRAGVRSLPAAHCLIITREKAEISRYWTLTARPQPASEAAEAFRELFTRSVANRMRGPSFAAMLSGGLDSSAIVCVAAELADRGKDRPPSAYSLVFPDRPALDESRHCEAVVCKTGWPWRRVVVGDEPAFADADTILEEQEGPYLSPGLATTRRLYRAAGANGERVLLDGHGGDEVVSHGYERLNELARDGRWLALWREVRGVSRIYGSNSLDAYMALVCAFGPRLPLDVGRRIDGLRRRLGPPPASVGSRERTVNEALAKRTDLAERQRALARERRSSLLDEARAHHANVTSGQVDIAFQILDKAAAAAGVEPRYPFWDRRLVEFCLSLPAQEKLSGGWSRLVHRRAMENILPVEVQWRTDKADFTRNLVDGMLRMKPFLDRTFGSDGDRIAPYVNLSTVRLAYARLREDPQKVGIDDLLDVWRAAWLSQWLARAEVRTVAA